MVIFRLFDEQLLAGFFAKPPELGFFLYLSQFLTSFTNTEHKA